MVLASAAVIAVFGPTTMSLYRADLARSLDSTSNQEHWLTRRMPEMNWGSIAMTWFMSPAIQGSTAFA